MRIWESKVINIDLDEKNGILSQKWKGFATSAQLREAIEKTIEISKQKKPKYILTDSLEAGVVKKEDTDWLASYAVPTLVKNGLKAQAFVIPTNAFVKLSVQNYSSQASGTLAMQYFDNLENANNWLKSL